MSTTNDLRIRSLNYEREEIGELWRILIIIENKT
jgi:hypothetical protein